MNTALTLPDVARFRSNPEVVALKARILEARAEAERTRADVRAYLTPVVRAFGYDSMDAFDADYDPDPAIYTAFDAAHRARGYDLPEGHCPALVAENKLLKLETEGARCIAALLGIDAGRLYGEMRERAIHLFMEA